MNIADEIYFETREESIREMYEDYLIENGLSQSDIGIIEFIDTL